MYCYFSWLAPSQGPETEGVLWEITARGVLLILFLQIKQDKPDIVPDLNDLVQENFTALKSTNSDLDLQRNEKFVLFQEQVKQMKTQCKSILCYWKQNILPEWCKGSLLSSW